MLITAAGVVVINRLEHLAKRRGTLGRSTRPNPNDHQAPPETFSGRSTGSTW
ncbi:hypothetical protein [Streptosporangium sp. KLBMP 9127]|nr:hypothetical protein [Streptosporangium sp. KLBMP 9127]